MKRTPYTAEALAADEAILSPEEARARIDRAMRELDGEELENLHSLIGWFSRRYPTPLDRFRYLRKKNAEAFARLPRRLA